MRLDEFYKIYDSIQEDEYGCLPWPKVTPGCYKTINVDGFRYYVHRFVLEKKLGRPIRPGYQALHICDLKNCVSFEHLYEGSPKDNVRDIKVRNSEGYRNWREAAAKAVRKGWKDPETAQKMLAGLKKLWGK
jgi:hypothetical protein